jgi:hypothetical protein
MILDSHSGVAEGSRFVLWLIVVGRVFTDVSKDHSSFFLLDSQPKKSGRVAKVGRVLLSQKHAITWQKTLNLR